MKPRVSVITLAVQDLEKSVAFYRDGLGWSTEGIIGQDIENYAVAFFDLQNGVKLALWPQRSRHPTWRNPNSDGGTVGTMSSPWTRRYVLAPSSPP